MAEAISQTQFDERLGNKELVVSLVGMSNCGKSWSAKKLVEEEDFDRLDCDAMIEADLHIELEREGLIEADLDDLEAVTQWMGQPGDDRFREREKRYLELEGINMTKILMNIKNRGSQRNRVVDTTGSVIYLPVDMREDLTESTTVVLFDFEITAEMQNSMFEAYVEKPKPVVWKTAFDEVRIGETVEDARRRCYPDLLQDRIERYKAMAHVVIPREVKYGFADSEELLNQIRESLPA